MKAPLAAYVSAILHVAAAAALVKLLRPGLPPGDPEQRLAYMQAHLAEWRMGWLVWQVTAIVLVFFYALLAVRLRTAGAVWGFTLVLTAAMFDVISEQRYAYVLPQLAGDAFRRSDRALEVLIGTVANGLYTAGLLFVLIAGRQVMSRALLLLGGITVASGAMLSVTSAVHAPRGSVVASAILFPAFAIWLVLAGRWLQRNAS